VEGRRIAGVALMLAGLAAIIAGLVGLLGGDGGGATAEPSPSGAASPTDETASPSASPSEATVSTLSPTASPAETPEEFFAALGAAFREGDGRFLFSRLHPFVIERYGEASCRSYLGGLDVPAYEVEVLDVEGTESFVYETDELRRLVPEAVTVRIRFTEDGSTFVETDGHIVLAGDRFQWFTDCGTPLGGAA
jgi:hypothetical protein